MGTRGVLPCRFHTCAWAGTCWDQSYLPVSERQVCVAQPGLQCARVVQAVHLLPEGQGHGARADQGGKDTSAFSQVFTHPCGPGGSSASLQGWPHPPFHHGGQSYKMAWSSPPEVYNSRGSAGYFCSHMGGQVWSASGDNFRQRCSIHFLKVVFLVQADGGQPHHHHRFPPPVQRDGGEVP